MKLPSGLFALSAVLLIVPLGVAVSRSPVSASPANAQARQTADTNRATTPATPVTEQPATVQGRTIETWLGALKNPDPTVRARAVEVLGERMLDAAVPLDEKARLQTAAIAQMLSDKDAEVRQTASFFAALLKKSVSPQKAKQVIWEWKRRVKPTEMPIRLVDAQGQPVAGAVASTFFQRDADREPSFKPSGSLEARTSDARGELAITLEIAGDLNAAAIYATRQNEDLPIVGLRQVSREEIRDGKPLTIVMHTACRVRLRVECPAFGELAKQYHAELGGPSWWRAAYVGLGEKPQVLRPLFTSSTTGQLEFLLPPGQYTVSAYGADTDNTDRTIEAKPGQRLLSLGVVEVSPNNAIKKGIFRDYWRSIRRDARATAHGLADDELITFRRARMGTGPDGEARQIQDTAYSPDGTLLATAHWYANEPGEVKLWDTKTGMLVVRLPVRIEDGGVLDLTFSPDGTILAGSVGSLQKPERSGVVVLWDIAGRRELNTLRGRSARISALAFATDGRTLASGGEDKTVRFWDVVNGRETGRIDSNPGWVRSLAYSPDGKTLAIGSGTTLRLWDVSGSRLGATLETKGFLVQSAAFAPDGRTLAVAGTLIGPGNRGGEGQVHLFDLAQVPHVRRAELTLHREGRHQPNRWMSDVAFTPDGRRVAALAMQTIVIWDAATGDEQNSLERSSSSSADRLTISPDGRWLAVSGLEWTGVRIFDIGPEGP